MAISLLAIFDKVWPLVQGLGLILEQLLKFIKNPILIRISSNFLHNLSTCMCIKNCNKNEKFSPSRF